MKYQALLLVVVFTLGCGSVAQVRYRVPAATTFAETTEVSPPPPPPTPFDTSWTPERCQKLLNQRDGLTWAVALGTGLTGAGGLSTAFLDEDKYRLSLGITSAVLAAITASFSVLVKVKSSEFEQYCNVESPESEK
jgi:hypothetical protein